MSGGRRRLTIGRLMGLVLGCSVVFAAIHASSGMVVVILANGLVALVTARILLCLAEVPSTRLRVARLAAGLLASTLSGVVAIMLFMGWGEPILWGRMAYFLGHPDAWIYLLGFSFWSIFLIHSAALIVAPIMGAVRWRRLRRAARSADSTHDQPTSIGFSAGRR
ncbi:hypothetical protein TA3x_002123 [Tundrisphaera sp. TA3]|uniref:hypothetical protein n=1 Tax=Tundrisphaera sp. TA3 TaxID=3435775 RepID=UPI003EB95415